MDVTQQAVRVPVRMQEPYREHYHEAGFNALFFIRAAHSWARSLRIVNADYGIGLEHAHFCTVEDVDLATDFKRDTLSRGMQTCAGFGMCLTEQEAARRGCPRLAHSLRADSLTALPCSLCGGMWPSYTSHTR